MSFDARALDALPLSVYTVDLDGRITSASHRSRHGARDPGARAPAGQLVWDLLAPRSAREPIEDAMRLLRTGRVPVVSFELGGDAPDDEDVLLLQVAALRDAHAIGGFVVAAIDITPSHRARATLLESGLALAGALDVDDAVQEAAGQLRRAIRCDGLVVALVAEDTALDPAALEIVYEAGYEGPRSALAERLAPDWASALAAGRVVVRATPQGVELTAPMTGRHGTSGALTVYAESLASARERTDAKRALGVIAAQLAAVVARAAVQRRATRTRRLQAMGEVAAGVAHELRNPLFGISSAAQLLRFRAQDDPVIERNVGRIAREVEQLNRLVGSLLDYARPATLELVPRDPDAVWDEVLATHRGRLEARALQMRRTREVTTARCMVDTAQLAQLFAQLLLNAVEAAPEASDLALVSSVRDGAWHCRLTNRGAPIAADVLPHIFDLFFSTRPGRAGVGLALARRIAEQHGGTIAAESTEAGDTTLVVALPVVHH